LETINNPALPNSAARRLAAREPADFGPKISCERIGVVDASVLGSGDKIDGFFESAKTKGNRGPEPLRVR
jgi:hypothetical protein